MSTQITGPLEVFGNVSIKQEKEIDDKNPEIEGIEIPNTNKIKTKIIDLKKEDEEIKYNAIYPLIPSNPNKNDDVLAYTKIFWDNTTNTYKYNIYEPQMSPKLSNLFMKIKELLEEKLDVDLSKLKSEEAKDYLKTQVFKLLDYFGIKLNPNERKVLEYYINRDFLGLGNIEALMHDSQIEEISCDGTNIPLFIFHRNSKLGSLQTNIIFNDSEELDNYLTKLAQVCGQSISITDPLLDGTLPDGSRIQGTLSTDIARRGSNFTIRKFFTEPFTPTHLIEYNTIDARTLAFLWLAIDYGASVLVSGGTATGKTSFLNVLSLFIRPSSKIVSIEDTSELRLPHSHWVPQIARVPISAIGEKKRGEIDLFDLLKESLRQRPDYIIVGEVRGKEAYVLFQQIATGHPSLATIHADTIDKLSNRLVSPPISLPPSLLESLDLVVFLTKQRYRGKHVRRVDNIFEISGFDHKTDEILTNNIFKWNSSKDIIETSNKSITLKKILNKSGMSEKEITEELKRRVLILEWLKFRNVSNYKDVGKVFDAYYSNPENILQIINGEL